MKLGSAALMGLLSLNMPGLAAQSPSPDALAVEKEVRQASDEWFDALAKRNVETLDRMETSDFYIIQRVQTGVEFRPKADQLATMRKESGTPPVIERSLVKYRVRQYGDVAVLTGISTLRAEAPNGQRLTSQAVVTEIWVRQNGRWMIAQMQSTDLPVAASPR